MKAERLKTERHIDSSLNRVLHIQSFGAYNDYPQRVMEIVEASATGSPCVNTYAKFINGRGFANMAIAEHKANEVDTFDELLAKVTDDYARFGGFAIHVNYNALYEIVEATHVPIEWLRFDELGEGYEFNRVALHRDWGKRYTALRRFKASEIERFYFYDPLPESIEEQVAEAGGWEFYKGQIFYYSNRGDKVYPMPIYNSVLTDMSNEEGLSNITQRNVRHNFLPAGMLVDYDNSAESEEQLIETKRELVEFQGDMQAGQLMYVNVKNGENPPEFRAFTANNYDSAFTNAEDKTPEIIGRAFVQPPILRGQDVGGNFGSALMENAYEFYNTITSSERLVLESRFAKIFNLWHNRAIIESGDFSILPLRYRVNKSLAEQLGDNTDRVIDIIDSERSTEKKRVILSKIYGLDNEDINELLGGAV